jgi:hypothetical protein
MSKLKAADVERAIRDRKIIRDRRAGKEIFDIAEEHSLSPQTISKIINDRLSQTIRLRDQEVDLLRQQELDRLDAIQAAAWPAAQEGHIDSLKICMNAVDRRCKLLGLDAPQQMEIISIGAIEAEIQRINRQLEVSDRPEWIDGEVIEDDQARTPDLGGSIYNPDKPLSLGRGNA